MKSWKPGVLIILLSLTLSLLIYFITRTEATLLNQWLVNITSEKTLDSLQQIVSNSSLPEWVVYTLPDALWMFAMSMTIMVIWKYQMNPACIFFTILATSAGAGHELLQGAKIIQGTFDILDLMSMVVAGLLPISVAAIKKCIHKYRPNRIETVHSKSIPSDVIVKSLKY